MVLPATVVLCGLPIVPNVHAQSVDPFGSSGLATPAAVGKSTAWDEPDDAGPRSPVGQLIEDGRTALAAGDPQSAAQRFTAALRQAPDDPALLNNLATARALLGDTGGALELLRRAVVLAPARADIRANLQVLSEWSNRRAFESMGAGIDDAGAAAGRSQQEIDGDRHGVTSVMQPW
jgi:tetratricopeptide (TPR) repeat protein